jgi:hypothetical protein
MIDGVEDVLVGDAVSPCRIRDLHPVNVRLTVNGGQVAIDAPRIFESTQWLRRGSENASRVTDGGMAERTIATVLKTVEAQASGGSNPPPSATQLPYGTLGSSHVDGPVRRGGQQVSQRSWP